MNKLVSIIVPVYNLENYIEKCIESLSNQTYGKIEIILVNDGSSDKCGEICEKWAEKDNRVKVIHKENGGLSSARNCGIDNATGEYIMFVDGDDFISETMVEKLYSSLTENDADMSVCSFRNIYEDGTPVCEMDNDNPITDAVMTAEDMYRALLKKGNWYYIVTWNKLYKREIWDDIRYPLGKIHEDEFVIGDIVSKTKRIATVSDRLYMYIQRRGSITNKGYTVKRLDVFDALIHRVEMYLDSNIADDITVLQTIAVLKQLYESYRKTGKDGEFSERYRQIHKDIKKLLKKVLKKKMSLPQRGFLTVNLISTVLSYKICKLACMEE